VESTKKRDLNRGRAFKLQASSEEKKETRRQKKAIKDSK
jgi:hypothetical protein